MTKQSDTPQQRSSRRTERVERLVVCRESDEQGWKLMEGMIIQTLDMLKGVPGCDEVALAGVEPLRKTGRFKGRYSTVGKSRSILFEYKGTVYFYFLGSAASRNQETQTNDFIDQLIEIITLIRPRTLYSAGFSRLIRSLEWSGTLMAELQRHVEVVHFSGFSVDMSSPAAKSMWSTLAMVADMERDEILRRTTTGRLVKYLDGKWNFGDISLPLGYCLDADGYVQINKEEVDGVRILLNLMANSKLTSREVVDAAAGTRLTSKVLKRIHGDDATIKDVERADSFLATVTDWMSVYRTGQVKMTIPNPFPGKSEFLGVRIVEAKNGSSNLELEYTFPLPPGGWCSDSVLEAAAQRTRGRKERRTGGAKHQKRRLLSAGYTWIQNNHHYSISGDGENYLILRQPVDPSNPSSKAWSSDRGRRGDRVASIRPMEIHEALSRSIGDALRQGTLVEFLDVLEFPRLALHLGREITEYEQERHELQQQVHSEDQLIARAMNNANTVTDEDLVADFLMTAEGAATRRKQILQQIEQLDAEEALDATTQDPSRFESSADYCAHAIARLATIESTTME